MRETHWILGVVLTYTLLVLYALLGVGTLLVLAYGGDSAFVTAALLLGLVAAPSIVAVTYGGRLLYAQQRFGETASVRAEALLGTAQLLGTAAAVSGVLVLGVLLYAVALAPWHARTRYLRGALAAFVAQLAAYGIAAFYRIMRPTPASGKTTKTA